MLILSVLGLMAVTAFFAVWLAQGGQQWRGLVRGAPITFLYDPTGEYTYMKDNPRFKS